VLDDAEKKFLIAQLKDSVFSVFPIKLINLIGYFGWHQLSRSGLPKFNSAILSKYYVLQYGK
jgi:hypothetical protein